MILPKSSRFLPTPDEPEVSGDLSGLADSAWRWRRRIRLAPADTDAFPL